MSLETYARERARFRAKVLEHKQKRTVRSFLWAITRER